MSLSELVKKIHDENLIGLNEINSVQDAEELHNRLIAVRSKLGLPGLNACEVMPHYRGQQNAAWDVTNGISRPPINIYDSELANKLEKEAIARFGKEVEHKFGPDILTPLKGNGTFGLEWALRTQAQHAGIKTNLIDCTPDVFSALYFASEVSDSAEIEQADGKMWYTLVPINSIKLTFDWSDTFSDIDPFDLNETYVINLSALLDNVENRLYEYRYFKQHGRLYAVKSNICHIPFNKLPFWGDLTFGINIPAGAKDNIRKELEELGITWESQYIHNTNEHDEIVTRVNSIYTT